MLQLKELGRPENQGSSREAVPLEEPLEPHVIPHLHKLFWNRHKFTVPARAFPADSLITHCVREIAPRAG